METPHFKQGVKWMAEHSVDTFTDTCYTIIIIIIIIIIITII
jgi:hypothetical protein